MITSNKIIELSHIDFLPELHDSIATKIFYKDKKLSIEILKESNKRYLLEIQTDDNYGENINVYNYKFHRKGKIKGKVVDFNFILKNDFRIQIIDFGYLYSMFFIKGTKLNEKLNSNRNYYIIEFVTKEKILMKELI